MKESESSSLKISKTPSCKKEENSFAEHKIDGPRLDIHLL